MKIRNSILFALTAFGIVCLMVLHSCKKPNETVPHNPYDDIHRDDTTAYGIPLDSLTITYVHKKVLSTRCALPGCHEGHFEPDFRTPQSSFSTLVYAPINKNNTAATYTYRVIPRDTSHSVLYARITNCCFVTQNDRMPQDNIGVPLPDSSINLIASWIMHGSRDMFGNVPKLPNKEPTINYYAAFDTISLVPPFAFPTKRYDTIRLSGIGYNPFVVPVNKSVFYFAVIVTDDSTAQGSLLVNKLKISTHADDFTAATQLTCNYINYGGFSAWLTAVPMNSLPTGDTLYMRYYVNDGSHANNTEFPRTDMVYPYKTFWSFIRQ